VSKPTEIDRLKARVSQLEDSLMRTRRRNRTFALEQAVIVFTRATGNSDPLALAKQFAAWLGDEMDAD